MLSQRVLNERLLLTNGRLTRWLRFLFLSPRQLEASFWTTWQTDILNEDTATLSVSRKVFTSLQQWFFNKHPAWFPLKQCDTSLQLKMTTIRLSSVVFICHYLLSSPVSGFIFSSFFLTFFSFSDLKLFTLHEWPSLLNIFYRVMNTRCVWGQVRVHTGRPGQGRTLGLERCSWDV